MRLQVLRQHLIIIEQDLETFLIVRKCCFPFMMLMFCSRPVDMFSKGTLKIQSNQAMFHVLSNALMLSKCYFYYTMLVLLDRYKPTVKIINPCLSLVKRCVTLRLTQSF